MNVEIASWDERFAGADYLFGTEPNAFLVRQAARIPAGGRVLAIADGEGRNGVWLAQQGFAVHATEGSANAVAKAARLAAERGVPVVDALDDLVPGSIHLECVDVLHWTYPVAAFDAIAAIFIQFIKPDERTEHFAAMARALRPGGVLLLEGYAPRQLEYGTGGPRMLEQLYDETLLRQSFPTLRIEELREYDVVIDEGTQHSGMSALIDLVAVAE